MRNLRRRQQTLDAWFGLFVEERRDRCASRTVDNYEVEWGRFCRVAAVAGETVGLDQVQAYIRTLQKTRNAQGVNAAWRHLRPFLNFLRDRGVIDWEPAAVVVPKAGREQKKPLTDTELGQLLRACRNPRDKAMLLLILDTGIRSRELRELRTSDVDLDGRQLWIRSGKGGKSRSLPFSGATGRALRAWALVREPETPWFFHNADHEYGTQMSMWHMTRTFARLGQAAGIKEPVGPHRLRHTFGRAFVAGGGNVFTLRQMLGHTTLSTSMMYVNLSGADLQKAHAEISPVKALLYGK